MFYVYILRRTMFVLRHTIYKSKLNQHTFNESAICRTYLVHAYTSGDITVLYMS